MVRNKLELVQEINKYLGLPYSKNILKDGKIVKEKILGGKGSCIQIASETIRIAQEQKIDLTKLSEKEFYNFQKKNHIGIDCSGLAVHLLNFYFGTNLNPRRTSAAMLTSKPLSQEISPKDATTGDLIRQKKGKHVLFIIEKQDNKIDFVESSFEGRGVHLGQADLTDPNFIHQGFFRLLLLN